LTVPPGTKALPFRRRQVASNSYPYGVRQGKEAEARDRNRKRVLISNREENRNERNKKKVFCYKADHLMMY
jgi:hypothetical protein